MCMSKSIESSSTNSFVPTSRPEGAAAFAETARVYEARNGTPFPMTHEQEVKAQENAIAYYIFAEMTDARYPGTVQDFLQEEFGEDATTFNPAAIALAESLLKK